MNANVHINKFQQLPKTKNKIFSLKILFYNALNRIQILNVKQYVFIFLFSSPPLFTNFSTRFRYLLHSLQPRGFVGFQFIYVDISSKQSDFDTTMIFDNHTTGGLLCLPSRRRMARHGFSLDSGTTGFRQGGWRHR